MLLKQLCEMDGVSGNEHGIGAFLKERVQAVADKITVDPMGNLIVFKKGKRHDKSIMVAAHMDEVGLIISNITEDGYLKFKTVGGIDTRVLISKRVRMGQVKGVIGIKAIHLQSKAERDSVPKEKELYIDIGAASKAEAEKMIPLGTYAAFDTEYADFGDEKIKAKALDDRVGCMVLLRALEQPCEVDLYACFTVQEEVGLRGAQTAAHRVRPDLALVLESTTCSDVCGTEEKDFVTRLGGGVALSFMDRSTIVDKPYRQWIESLAKEANLPFQYKSTTMGGNDAGAIHQAREGVKTASLSVPCRYLHSPVGIVSKKDICAMEELTFLILKRIGEVI